MYKERLPQPLPLPSPMECLNSAKGNFRLCSASGPFLTSVPLPLPPLERGLQNFSLEDISMASIKQQPPALSCFQFSSQGLREFLNQVNIIASLKHPQLCKVLGFHASEGSSYQRMIVYEGSFNGSLDRILYGRTNLPSLDWNARMKIALSAAKGLAFLHEDGPFQAMYSEFSSANIQVNKDFSAKLAGYGCVGHNNPEAEQEKKGLITPKSNVRSFGIVLVELITGRKDFVTFCSKVRDIVRWSNQFLADESRLSLIIDPRLKGRFPLRAVQIVAQIALSCLHKDPSKRPTMRTVAGWIENANVIKYSCGCPLQEPSAAAKGQRISRLSSFDSVTNGVPSSSSLLLPTRSL